ncbi:hypothetical protein [Vaginisenegalia massiliensis]|uniref:hypothetical protein n=1 Tax=Vaginisenegalia massiliensis TaxID=2058294 RepID=UPI000F523815|nr:hypothetical protein [Vaginisenegalia massiliensis]
MYEGPAFNKPKSNQHKEPRFIRQINEAGQRSHFEPAYHKGTSETESEKKERLNQKLINKNYQHELDAHDDLNQKSESKYQIPFKNVKQDLNSWPKKDQEGSEQTSSAKSLFDRQQFEAKQEMEAELASTSTRPEPSPRAEYEPSFRQRQQTPEEAFQSRPATVLPKPYQKTQAYDSLEAETRQLAKRLVKTKDSFLLFEK